VFPSSIDLVRAESTSEFAIDEQGGDNWNGITDPRIRLGDTLGKL